MGSLPPVLATVDAPRPAPPPMATTTSVGEGMVLWAYVDEALVHELQAGMRKGDPLTFFIREAIRGFPDPADAMLWETPLDGTWESRIHHQALEERLALLGRYQRQNVGTQGWRPVHQPTGNKRLMLDPLLSPAVAPTHLHHYGSANSARSTLILVTPVATAAGTRYRVAQLVFDFPEGESGRLSVVHPRLPEGLVRSVLAHLHLQLTEAGLVKVPHVDRALAANAPWCDALDAAAASALQRLDTGDLGRGKRRSILEAPLAVKAPKVTLASERTYQIEDALPAGPDKAPEVPVAKIEDVSTDYYTAMTHPKVLALHTKYLEPGEEARALDLGELGITHLMKRKRAAHGADEQHRLSILEASLMARHHFSRPGKRSALDPHFADLLRRALAYL